MKFNGQQLLLLPHTICLKSRPVCYGSLSNVFAFSIWLFDKSRKPITKSFVSFMASYWLLFASQITYTFSCNLSRMLAGAPCKPHTPALDEEVFETLYLWRKLYLSLERRGKFFNYLKQSEKFLYFCLFQFNLWERGDTCCGFGWNETLRLRLRGDIPLLVLKSVVVCRKRRERRKPQKSIKFS